MIILDVGIGYDLCGLDCEKKKKIYKYFEMSFSCLGPFAVWVVTSLLGALVADYDGMRNWSA